MSRRKAISVHPNNVRRYSPRVLGSVKPPVTTHEVSIRQLEKWTAATAKSPHEGLLKSRVRALLDRKP